MKYLNILALAVVAFTMVACDSKDDEPKTNSMGGVTVCMADADLTFLETKGIVRVPFDVKGERNGYVTVTCETHEFGDEVAMENVQYLVTDYTVNVDTMDNSGYFEIKIVDDSESNPNRQFIVKIVNVEGGSVSGLDTTVITIKDNDSDPYLRLSGEWKVTGKDESGAPMAARTIRIDAFDENQSGYYSYYNIVGLTNMTTGEPCTIKADFNYDEVSKEGTITISYGQEIGTLDNSGTLITGKLGWVYVQDGYYYIGGLSGDVVYTWTENGREIKIVSWPGENEMGTAGAYFSTLGYVGGSLNYVLDFIADVATMTKVIN